MAHIEQLAFVEILSKEISRFNNCKKILEIGSYDVNGSIRPFFENSDYIGVDLIEGKGVDFVRDGHTLDYLDESFDMVISCESFEHNPYWKETFLNMIRMTKLGGLIVFTCATTGRPEHGTTRTTSVDSPGTIQMNWDYYKNLKELDFYNEIFDFKDFFGRFLFLKNNKSKDLYFVGVKRGSELTPINFKNIRFRYFHFKINQKIQIFYSIIKNRFRFIKRILKG